MVKAYKFNSLGEQMEEIELPASIFDVDVNSPKVLLHEVVTMYLGNQRQGTVQKKNRAMTAGSTRKLFRSAHLSGCMADAPSRSCPRTGTARYRAAKSAWRSRLP